MSTSNVECYEAFSRQFAEEVLRMSATVRKSAREPSGLSYEAWCLSMSEYARRTATSEDAWQAGATAMFQALVERGFIAPYEVEQAIASTADVLTT
jgi:hypothetical protein